MATKWTEQQMRVFQWFGRPTAHERTAVVRARAGSGKTHTLVEGLKYAPETLAGRVLLAAFNKRIADELVKKAPRRVQVKTLHALGLATLRLAYGRVDINDQKGREIAQVVCGSLCPREMVAQAVKLAAIGKLTLTSDPERLVRLAADFDLEPPAKFSEVEPVEPHLMRAGMGPWTTERLAEAAATCMRAAAEATDSCDFDDMLWIPYARSLSPTPFDLVVVDECQDMNRAQLWLATRAVRKGGRLCVVGDNFQAIYAFMAADSDGIDRMKRELGAVEFPLSVTFRCPARVVRLAQAYVADYQSAPEAPVGEISTALDMDQVAGMVAEGDFILSRSNAGAAEACLTLLRAGVRATVIGRDVGASLKKLVEGFGVSTVQDLTRAVGTWAEAALAKAKAQGAESKVERVLDQVRTIDALASGLITVRSLLDRIDDLFSDRAVGRVACSTVHKAKGLEAEQVFVLVETFRASPLQEEDNLKYVAITRTKRSLVFVGAPPHGKAHPFEDALARSAA